MKIPPGLAASLLLNAVLLVLVARGRPDRPPEPPRMGTEVSEAPATRFGPGSSAPDQSRAGFAGTDGEDEVNWARLNTADWYAYRDGLRAWGCPERTIREILEPAIGRHYAAQMRALAAPWVAGFWELARDPESFRRLDESVEPLKEEMNDLLTSLLGGATEGPQETPALGADTEARLAFLPEGTRQQVEEVLLDHRRRLAELHRSPPADTTRLAAAQRELDAQLDRDLAAVLSPEQLAEYRLRQSPHAAVRDLEGIELSREELGDIVAIQDRLAADPDLRDNRAGLARRSREELEKRLGPGRFAEFERAGNADFQSLSALANRNGASPEQAVRFWEIREKFRREVESLAGEPSSPRARQEALLAVLRDTLGRQAEELLGGRPGREMWEQEQRSWLEETFRLRRKNPFAGGTGQ